MSNCGSNLPVSSLTRSQNWKMTAPSSSMRTGPQPGCSCTPSATAVSISCGLAGMSRRFSSEVRSTCCAPCRSAVRATSMETLPPPMTTTRGPTRTGSPLRTACRKSMPAKHEGLMDPFDREQARLLRAEAEEDGVVVLAEGFEAGDRGVGVDLDAQHPDLVDFLLEQVGRQAIGRDAVAQHARRPAPAPRRSRPRDRRCAGSRQP